MSADGGSREVLEATRYDATTKSLAAWLTKVLRTLALVYLAEVTSRDGAASLGATDPFELEP